ncbi:Phosphoesterase RecJ-like protein [Candidatus Zixiibacteriota bacterium]|nr:Phosphoesterase RecJ-like protein [candidate division Zixibacteria bacterium]
MKSNRKKSKVDSTIPNKIADLIRQSKSVLITSHEDPDGDSLGSQLAVRRFLRAYKLEGSIVNQGKIPFKYMFLPDIDLVNDAANFEKSAEFDLAVVLERPNIERNGKVSRLIGKATKIINIDHHPDNSGFGDLIWVDPKASSVGEMLFELFDTLGAAIDTEMATQIYTAILTDTGRFRFRSTSRRTMEIAGRLIELGANSREICDQVYYSYPPSTIKLIGHVLSRVNFYADGRICLLQLDRKALEESRAGLGDVDGLADYTLYGKDVKVGGLLKELDDNLTKVSLRSRDQIDVSRLAHKYGGGGHYNAAGFAVKLPIIEAEQKLLQDLEGMLNG